MVVHRRGPVANIPKLCLASKYQNLTESPLYQPGNKSSMDSRVRKVVVKPQPINGNWPRGRNIINDNNCVTSVASKKNCVHVTGKSDMLNCEGGQKNHCFFVTSKRKTVYILHIMSYVVTPVPFAGGLKGVNPNIVHRPEIEYVNNVSCVDLLNFVQNVTNVQIVAIDLPVGARLHQFGENGQPWQPVPESYQSSRKATLSPSGSS